MKRSHEDLVSLLASSMKIDSESAEKTLSDWVESLKKSLDDNGSCRIPGLGTFDLKNGILSFTPDEELAIEVNYKYAGMDEIEIQPAYAPRSDPKKDDVSSGDISPDEPEITDETELTGEEDVTGDKEVFGDFPGLMDEPEEQAGELDTVDEVVGGKDANKKDSGDIDEFDVAEGFDIGDKASDVVDEDAPWDEKKSASDLADEIFGEHSGGEGSMDAASEDPHFQSPEERQTGAMKDAPESKGEKKKIGQPEGITIGGVSAGKKEQKAAPEEPKGRKKASAKVKTAKKESSSRVWLVPIAAALILAVLLFFHFEAQILDRRYTTQFLESETPVVLPDEDEETGQPPPPHEIGQTEDLADIADVSPGIPEAEIPAAENDEDNGPFGLTGTVEELHPGAYTIVLHSISNENRALIERNNLEDEGYIATLSRASLTDGSITWRVGVGQFENVSDAEDAISDLPEPYRSNNFIIRIR
jgi:hypothetical protein